VVLAGLAAALIAVSVQLFRRRDLRQKGRVAARLERARRGAGSF
jgi:hypothetical protein